MGLEVSIPMRFRRRLRFCADHGCPCSNQKSEQPCRTPVSLCSTSSCLLLFDRDGKAHSPLAFCQSRIQQDSKALGPSLRSLNLWSIPRRNCWSCCRRECLLLSAHEEPSQIRSHRHSRRARHYPGGADEHLHRRAGRPRDFRHYGLR